MNIKVLGGGCRNCENLLAAVKEAVAEKGIEAEIEYITDMAKIMETFIVMHPTRRKCTPPLKNAPRAE